MAIPVLDVTEPYAALTVLKQSQLNTMVASVETYINTNVRLNLVQIGLDTFGVSYNYTNDGIASQVTPLITQAALLADNEIIQGSWTFNGPVALAATAPVTSASTFTSSGQTRCRPYLATANQTLADATSTALVLNNETYDVGSMHDNSVNPSRITIPTGGAGIYYFSAQATFTANATGRREIAIFKNGSKIAENKLFTNDAAQDTVLQVGAYDSANQNDYYEVFVYQNRGGTLDVKFGERVTFFSCQKLW